MKKTFILLMVFFLLAGCNTAQNEVKDGTDHNENETIPLNVSNKNRNQKTEESKNKNVTRNESEAVSKRLANLAASVPQVNNATAVALGRFAVVAIDVDKDLDRSKVGTIKYSVAETLKSDPNGANAVIVADPDIYQRLQEMGDEIQNGRPIRGILNELADIVGRIMPELPGDLKEPSPEKEVEEPKDEMNKSDQNNLEKTRKKQSKAE